MAERAVVTFKDEYNIRWTSKSDNITGTSTAEERIRSER